MVKRDYLEVFGHSGFDIKGKDVICASVSALVTGSAELWKNSKFVKITKSKDKFTFEFWLNEGEESRNLRTEFHFLTKHLKLLSKIFPEYIKYSEN